MMRLFLAVASVIFSSAFTVGLAQPLEVLRPTGVYTQASTGMTYPQSVGDFQRVSIIRYKQDGTDESAGYNRPGSLKEIVATVYVFPSPALRSFGSQRSVIQDARNRLCAGQFKGIKNEVMSAHPDAVLLREGATTLAQSNGKHDGYFAAHKLTNRNFAGRNDVLLRSDTYVFCYAGGKWTVEYRIDYPFDYDAGPAVADFMRDLIWTIPPEPGN